MKKQLPLTATPELERAPFSLDGEPGVEFDPRAPWPMPQAKPYAAQPLELTLRERWHLNKMRVLERVV